MGNFNFGIPSKSEKGLSWDFKQDKAVIKIAKNEGLRKSKDVFLNKKAWEALAVDNELHTLGISFNIVTKEVYLANVVDLEIKQPLRVTKNAPYKFSNVYIYNYLAKFLNLDLSVDHYFELQSFPNEFKNPIFKLVVWSETEMQPISYETLLDNSTPSTEESTNNWSTTPEEKETLLNSPLETENSNDDGIVWETETPELLKDVENNW